MRPHAKLLVGIAVGAGLGLCANLFAAKHPALLWTVDNLTHPVGQIFLRLLFMLVIPVLFSALVMGVCELPLGRLGWMGVRTLGYTVVVSLIAVTIGLVLVNTLGPGRGVSSELLVAARSSAPIQAAPGPADSSAVGLIISMVPDNAVKSAANGDMIGLIVFSLIFGIGVSLTQSDATQSLKQTIAGLYDVTMRLLELILKLAPVGVGALMFTMVSRLGAQLLVQLGAYVGVVLLGLALHMFVVYSLSVKFLGGMSPLAFFRGSRLAIATAFATASSNATLPTALRVAEEELKLPRHVSRFVMTAGSTMNQNGTALFEGVTVLFLAQLYGVELTLPQQGLVMFFCVLGGIGTAGVPAGSIPVVVMILGRTGIPVEGIGLILGVDRILDMCRTVLNVTGDLAAAVYVSRGERGEVAAPAAIE